MKGRSTRSIWPVLMLGTATIIVLTLLTAFIVRLLNPPILPFVESDERHPTIQINIVNASGKNGAGRTAMKYLRERGFDVVELSTDDDRKDHSYIIDRVGDRITALKVARVLGVPDSMVVSGIDSMLFVNASVILGSDLITLHPFQES
jgi:hypothetical protein